MKKNLFTSKTAWGGILLAVEAAILSSEWTVEPMIQIVLAAFGTFLTVYGFRDAMNGGKA